MIAKLIKPSLIVLTVAMLSLGLSACEKKGPAEKAGEAIDQTVEKAGDKAAEVGDAVGDKMEEAGDKIEKATD